MSELVLRLNEYRIWRPLEIMAEGALKFAVRAANALGLYSVAAKVANGLGIYSFATRLQEALGAEGEEGISSQDRAARASAILDDYGNSILRTAYMYLHNMSDAEDILQDTLVQYIRKAPAFTGSDHEKAWLLTVAANLAKNKIKYNKLRQTDELAEELVGEEEQDLAFVWEAVKQLPEKYREVIHLFYQEGYATSDIANILGRNESTVRSDLKRGRDKLKEILKEAYDFE